MVSSRHIVVCDNGSAYVKCGFAGDSTPTAVIPTVMGRLPVQFDTSASDEILPNVVVGEQYFGRQSHSQPVELSYPISNGVVQKWDDMCVIWDHLFSDHLHINPAESKILLTDPPLNPTRNRQKLVQIMFEKFGFEALFVQLQAVLPLYAQGMLTGLVVDCGEGSSYAVPVVEGYVFSHLTKRLNLAGRQLTAQLIDLLLRRGYQFSKTADARLLRQVKEKLCYVSCDFVREQQLAAETTVLVKRYTLPDGRQIKVGAERFEAPEVLFNPVLLGGEGEGLAEMVFRTIQETDIDNRMAMYQNIVLSGGTTMLPGFTTRLEREIKDKYLAQVLRGNKEGLKKLKLRIEDPPYRRHSVFVGGAVLADIMKDKSDFWISKQEYEEEGVRCLKKCET